MVNHIAAIVLVVVALTIFPPWFVIIFAILLYANTPEGREFLRRLQNRNPRGRIPTGQGQVDGRRHLPRQCRHEVGCPGADGPDYGIVLCSSDNRHGVDFPQATGSWPGSEVILDGQLRYSDIAPGKGKDARAGDKVKFNLIEYHNGENRHSCHSTLGKDPPQYGRGIDLGIIGMRIDGIRRLAIREDLWPKLRRGRQAWRVPRRGRQAWRAYVVTLTSINGN